MPRPKFVESGSAGKPKFIEPGITTRLNDSGFGCPTAMGPAEVGPTEGGLCFY